MYLHFLDLFFGCNPSTQEKTPEILVKDKASGNLVCNEPGKSSVTIPNTAGTQDTYECVCPPGEQAPVCTPKSKKIPASIPGQARNYYGGCFTAETLLQTCDGTIDFAAIAKLAAARESLPKVASYNEETGEVVWQVPDSVIVHGRQARKLLCLSLLTKDHSRQNLQVTSIHPLLVQRGNKKIWVPAGNISSSDIVVGENGVCFTVDQANTKFYDVEDAVYNLHFEGPGVAHTFFVSADGKNWVAAHNKFF